MKRLREADLISLLKKKQGERTASEFAREIGISPSYLSDIYLGRRAPGPSVLEFMGVEKTYVVTGP